MFIIYLTHKQKNNRSRDSHRAKRKWLRRTQKAGLEFELRRSFTENHKGGAMVLLHLSEVQWRRFASNTIHLSGRYYSDDRLCYSNVEYGKSIQKQQKKAMLNEDECWYYSIQIILYSSLHHFLMNCLSFEQ